MQHAPGTSGGVLFKTNEIKSRLDKLYKVRYDKKWQLQYVPALNLIQKNMPEITRFYGIIIKLFFADHTPPHFHAIYGEHVGLFNIETLEMMEGDLPPRARKLVLEWAKTYKSDLTKMWNTQQFQKLPPLE